MGGIMAGGNYSQKNKSKGKKNWGKSTSGGASSRGSSSASFEAINPIFPWLPTGDSLDRKALSLWPEPSSFKKYLDPFLGHGYGWTKASEHADQLYVNDHDEELISAMRLTSRGEHVTLVELSKWIRLWGIVDAWSHQHAERWLVFHQEHVHQQVEDVQVLQHMLSPIIRLTCLPLFEDQEKSFNYGGLFFKQAVKVAMLACMQKCLKLAQSQGGPLDQAALDVEIGKALKTGVLLYVERNYLNSLALKNYIDPIHVLWYVIIRSIAIPVQGLNGQTRWNLGADQEFADYERSFKYLGHPTRIQQSKITLFSHNDVSVFLEHAPLSHDEFLYAKIPDHYDAQQFPFLYDAVWKRNDRFLIVARSAFADLVLHHGDRQTFSYHNEDYALLRNY